MTKMEESSLKLVGVYLGQDGRYILSKISWDNILHHTVLPSRELTWSLHTTAAVTYWVWSLSLQKQLSIGTKCWHMSILVAKEYLNAKRQDCGFRGLSACLWAWLHSSQQLENSKCVQEITTCRHSTTVGHAHSRCCHPVLKMFSCTAFAHKSFVEENLTIIKLPSSLMKQAHCHQHRSKALARCPLVPSQDLRGLSWTLCWSWVLERS